MVEAKKNMCEASSSRQTIRTRTIQVDHLEEDVANIEEHIFHNTYKTGGFQGPIILKKHPSHIEAEVVLSTMPPGTKVEEEVEGNTKLPQVQIRYALPQPCCTRAPGMYYRNLEIMMASALYKLHKMIYLSLMTTAQTSHL